MGILEKLEIDYDLDIVEDFLSHYGIMCDSMEPVIIDLAKKEKYKEKINELFRIFHNIKSAASFLKLDPIVKLAILCEEVSEEARSLNGPSSDEFIDWLLMVADQFGRYRNDVERDADFFSILEPLIIKIPTNLEK